MVKEKDEKFVITINEKLTPKVSLWFSQFQLIRKKLLKTIETISQEELDFTPDERTIETIGTLLLHIAGVEWSWIFSDIDKKELSNEEWKYAFPLRKEVNLPQLKGQSKSFYIDRLQKVREEVYARLLKMTDDDLGKIIVNEEEEEEYSIEWILYHILEHEILHFGQIKLLQRLFKINKNLEQ